MKKIVVKALVLGALCGAYAYASAVRHTDRRLFNAA